MLRLFGDLERDFDLDRDLEKDFDLERLLTEEEEDNEAWSPGSELEFKGFSVMSSGRLLTASDIARSAPLVLTMGTAKMGGAKMGWVGVGVAKMGVAKMGCDFGFGSGARSGSDFGFGDGGGGSS